MTSFIDGPSHVALVPTLVLLEWADSLDTLSVHISLVNLAAEALVCCEAHSEVADLDLEKLENREDEWDREHQHQDHCRVKHERGLQVEDL